MVKQLDSVLPFGEPIKNERLFSNHFIKDVLPKKHCWTSETSKQEEAFAKLKALRESRDDLETLNEAQLQEAYIRPVLKEILGFTIEPEAEVYVHKGTKKADQALFIDEAARKEAHSIRPDLDAYWAKTLAVQESKQWKIELDQFENSPLIHENQIPSVQIDKYIRGSRCTWGVLTNGRYWRLYHKESSFRLDTFYEIDLDTVISSGNPDLFRFFYLFFRKEAFLPFEDKPSFLEWCLGQSKGIGVAIETDLQQRAYKALGLIIEGFLNHEPNKLTAPEDLGQIHKNSIILLYRILFILYAEARGFLQKEKDPYHSGYSLEKVLHDMVTNRHFETDSDDRLYSRLRLVFKLLDPSTSREKEDAAKLGIPPYNGGLFSATKFPFLEEKRAGSDSLLKALRHLAFAKAKNEELRIDYYELGTRQLGSIYEGLLEYCPKVAEGYLVEKRQKGVIRYEETTEAKKAVYKPGGIYFETDKGERKATGSYYTPDYIVQYIVEKTLGPLCDEISDNLCRDIEEKEKQVKQSRGFNKNAYQKELDELKCQYDDRVLALKVLDPAMGSGHFLVGACEYLAQRIASHPFTSAPAAPKDGEAAIHFWKRQVATHCLYGVDLNPLAVELAKLSLWLSTISKEKPLSFLDAHLRVGNSLIGASLDQFMTASGNPFTANLNRDRAILLSRTEALLSQPENTIEEVKFKEKLYADFSSLLEKYRDVADLHCLDELTGKERTEAGILMNHISEPTEKYHEVRGQFSELLKQAEDRHFFHWELEFPEIFLDQRKEEGFDAVIGNPPYGASFDEGVKKYFDSEYATASGNYESYEFFLEKSVQLLTSEGYLSFIVPDTWFSIRGSMPLRRYLLENSFISEIQVLNEKVFLKAKIDVCTIVLKKTTKRGKTRILLYDKDAPDFEMAKGMYCILRNYFALKTNGW